MKTDINKIFVSLNTLLLGLIGVFFLVCACWNLNHALSDINSRINPKPEHEQLQHATITASMLPLDSTPAKPDGHNMTDIVIKIINGVVALIGLILWASMYFLMHDHKGDLTKKLRFLP